ncbi:epimerase [Frankia sp. CcI49]|uniref:NAD-dependent epimerase/dehydratase family protein n=1 Tax=unclassified Frankia TaxID=2632575 RepID=UPI0006C9FF7E|nr:MULTISPECIES: NAD-dependent epimerase/dehydratase family protein [unclassified Frankia]KPM54938.1 epimerase [Frankia sp. R43]ONH61144.1 epimerase [Frankia sp. CcI49]
MRLFVVGGSGFLGSRTVRHALAAGHQVTGLARGGSGAGRLTALGAKVVRGDLDDAAALRGAFAETKADALLNIASLGFGHADTIVETAVRAHLTRALFVSTTGIFTALDPPSKQTRLAAENTIRTSGLDWTIIRPTMIYGGPDDRNMARLLNLLQHWPMLPIPLPAGGHQLHQPVHVDDLAELLVRAVELDITIGRTYNAAGPAPLTLRQVVEQAGAAAGRRPRCLPIPVRPVAALIGSYERRSARPRLKREQISRLTEDKAFSIADAVRDLGFAPRPFATGIRQEAALCRSQKAARRGRTGR